MRKPPVPKKLKPSDFIQLSKDKKRLGSNRAVAEEWSVSTSSVYYALHPKLRREKYAKERKNRVANPEKTHEYNVKGNHNYRVAHPERVLLNNAKHRAKKNHLPFNLVEADIHIPEKCPILGITLKAGKGNVKDASPTIDRFTPKRGYVRGNIDVISHKANTLKNNITDPSVFDALAVYLRRHQ